jgi:hypothetical protein
MRGKLRISLVGASTRIAEPAEVKITITSFRVQVAIFCAQVRRVRRGAIRVGDQDCRKTTDNLPSGYYPPPTHTHTEVEY